VCSSLTVLFQIAMICICFVSLLVALYVRTMDHRRRRKLALEAAAVKEEEDQPVADTKGDSASGDVDVPPLEREASVTTKEKDGTDP
jgi:hypothetical protein